MYSFDRRSWQEERQGHATSNDDVRHDGRCRHGSNDVKSDRFDGWQSSDIQ